MRFVKIYFSYFVSELHIINNSNNISSSSAKSKKFIRFVRLVATVVLIVIIYKYFYKAFTFDNFIDQFTKTYKAENLFFLLFAILLMPLNWILESAKWKYIIGLLHKMSWKEAISSVFQGTSLGVITPGRVGEYGGRVIQLPAEYRAFGVFSTFVSSLAQNTINVLGGIIAILLIDVKYADVFISMETFTRGAIAILVMILFLYFSVNKLWVWAMKISFVEKYLANRAFENFFPLWNLRGKCMLLFQSFLRYSVYVLQYYLLLKAFGIPLEDPRIVFGIMLIFAVQTLLPLTPILQFTVRGSIAITILTPFISGSETVLAMSYTMWLLNLLIPAIVGAVSMYWLRGKG
ncbi:flippase-like domain-containing protein [Saprospiraceae bacterium]|nr:flippase-like domain-containing protein [Saprospiraceae bacterium]